jgi:hypothetical protein
MESMGPPVRKKSAKPSRMDASDLPIGMPLILPSDCAKEHRLRSSMRPKPSTIAASLGGRRRADQPGLATSTARLVTRQPISLSWKGHLAAWFDRHNVSMIAVLATVCVIVGAFVLSSLLKRPLRDSLRQLASRLRLPSETVDHYASHDGHVMLQCSDRARGGGRRLSAPKGRLLPGRMQGNFPAMLA